jgi:type VI secretion system secreted protein VgrG
MSECAQVSVAEMSDQLTHFESAQKEAFNEYDARVSDYLTWFQSPKLVEAFGVYDEADGPNGLCFSAQSALCCHGTEKNAQLEKVFEQWWDGNPLDETNLAYRGLCYNQKEILSKVNSDIVPMFGEVDNEIAIRTDAFSHYAKVRKEAEFLESMRVQFNLEKEGLGRNQLKSIKEQYEKSLKTITALEENNPLSEYFTDAKRIKELSKLFDKAEEWGKKLQGDHQPFVLGTIMVWTGKLNYEILRRAGKPGVSGLFCPPAIRALASAVTGVFGQASAAASGTLKPDTKLTILNDFKRAVSDTTRSEFYRVRGASILCVIQALMLLRAAKDTPQTTDGSWDYYRSVGAGVLTMGAAGLELVSRVSVAAMSNGVDTATAKAAELTKCSFGGVGGMLSGFAGLFMAYSDVQKVYKNFDDEKYLLSSAYLSRAFVGGMIAASGMSNAIGKAEPLAKLIAEKYGEDKVRSKLATGTVKLAQKFAAIRIVSFLGGPWGWVISIGIEILLFSLKENAMKKWCEKSVFRANSGGAPYKNVDKEINAFYEAISDS